MSTIEVHENTVSYIGRTLRVRAVYLDAQLASDEFEPFDASSDLINSGICKECYASTGGHITTCNDRNIAVRRHGDTVYWLFADCDWIHPLRIDVPLDRVWEFTVDEYETQLQGSADRLRDFTSADVRLLLGRGTIFQRHLGLYTIPELEDDPQGRNLLDIIEEVAATHDMTICDAPERYRTIRVGIETEGVPETILEIGSIDDKPVVRFVANPGFPLWLTSALIQQRFAGFVE
jgi:hypothetical protein